jgi:two-component system sensor histidine kinase AtoS
VPPERLTARHLQLMTAIADQLAVALQKAKLYAELQASLHQEKTTRSQLIHSERLAVVGRLLASVAHELNNPLQAIQNALFLIKEEEKLSAQGSQDLEIVLSETERMAVLIERLHATYRPTRTENFQDIQLNTIIEDVYTLIATHMRHKEITFEFLSDRELPVVSGIPDQIRQVVLNLFLNAVEAMQAGGHITMRTEQLPEQGTILLSVIDNGPGIDAEILPHIFEPFITSKETGTGLGLTIIYDILLQHGGDIQAENNPDGGAIFKVWLPIQKKD